jgi:hypothetical protein
MESKGKGIKKIQSTRIVGYLTPNFYYKFKQYAADNEEGNSECLNRIIRLHFEKAK